MNMLKKSLIPIILLTLTACGSASESTMSEDAEGSSGIKCANLDNEFFVFSDCSKKIFDEDNLYEQLQTGEYALCGSEPSQLSMCVVPGDDSYSLRLEISVDDAVIYQDINEAGDAYLINLDYDDKYTEIAVTDYADPHDAITFYRYDGSEIKSLGTISASWSAPDFRRAGDLSLCEGSLYSDLHGRLITGADFSDYSDNPALSGYWDITSNKLSYWKL